MTHQHVGVHWLSTPLAEVCLAAPDIVPFSVYMPYFEIMPWYYYICNQVRSHTSTYTTAYATRYAITFLDVHMFTYLA